MQDYNEALLSEFHDKVVRGELGTHAHAAGLDTPHAPGALPRCPGLPRAAPRPAAANRRLHGRAPVSCCVCTRVKTAPSTEREKPSRRS